MFVVRLSEGTGIAIGSFERGENRRFQYNPDEFGFPDTGRDFNGRLRSAEGVLFLGYGITRSIAVAFEAAIAAETFRKASNDASGLPARLHESGLGDVQAEVDVRLFGQGILRPGGFLVTEVVFPHSKNRRLIGSPGLLIRPALGAYKNVGRAIILARLAGEYDSDSGTQLDWGEWGLEVGVAAMKSLRLAAGFEGTVGGANNFDEVSLVTDLQWMASGTFGFRAQSGTGFTEHSRGFSPEVGLMIRF
ncbi:MAG: hypothetical protein ABI556_11015, partial [Gemmatimonadales bacterium]